MGTEKVKERKKRCRGKETRPPLLDRETKRKQSQQLQSLPLDVTREKGERKGEGRREGKGADNQVKEKVVLCQE